MKTLKSVYCKLRKLHVGFKVLTAEVMKVVTFWGIVPCSPYMNQHSSKTLVHMRTTHRYIPEVVKFLRKLHFVH
jgi:hypothetical protein